MSLRPALLPALGVFAAAARHQNFAHAADELHLTASAVSHHVRKLEALLGVVLFQRHARGVKLTLEGRQLADAANAALGDIDAVASHLKLAGKTTTLRITTLHSLAYCWLLPRLPRFCARHPHIRLHVDTGIALTRFDGLGGALGAIPLGPTLPEMTAVLGALGARDAVFLDGGLSAQMAVRHADSRVERWDGMRGVPLWCVGMRR